jgi:hypothetical protein
MKKSDDQTQLFSFITFNFYGGKLEKALPAKPVRKSIQTVWQSVDRQQGRSVHN